MAQVKPAHHTEPGAAPKTKRQILQRAPRPAPLAPKPAAKAERMVLIAAHMLWPQAHLPTRIGELRGLQMIMAQNRRALGRRETRLAKGRKPHHRPMPAKSAAIRLPPGLPQILRAHAAPRGKA